ncbi:MAG: sulfotransferase [Planctomycetaceae bacterium]
MKNNAFVKYFGPACLAGITLSDWIRLLAQNRWRVAPRYWGKAAFISTSSLLTSILRPLESVVYRSRLQQLQPEAPIFIVGCWRSGTTHLHNLLCLDERFAAPNMYQTMYPHTFLLTEAVLRPLLDAMTPHKRFMDNMPQGLQEPHEDEMALAIMTLCSNMLSWAFPRNAARYDVYLDFADATEQELSLWKSCFDHFVRKIALKTNKRVILKSPNHTARLHSLRQLYPDAKFLHIRRHPCDVFRSMCHMAAQVQPVWGLQVLPSPQIPDMVIDTYRRLYDAYRTQSADVPATQLHEIAYDQLIADPVAVLERAYDALELGEFAAVKPKIEEYAAANSGYQRNTHADLPDADRERLRREWDRFFHDDERQ